MVPMICELAKLPQTFNFLTIFTRKYIHCQRIVSAPIMFSRFVVYTRIGTICFTIFFSIPSLWSMYSLFLVYKTFQNSLYYSYIQVFSENAPIQFILFPDLKRKPGFKLRKYYFIWYWIFGNILGTHGNVSIL